MGDQPNTGNYRFVIGGLILWANFAAGTSFQAMSPLLPLIERDYGIGHATGGLLMGSVLIIVAAWKSGARWRRPETSWPLAICGLMLAGYCLPFLVVPDWEDNLDWASGRLVAELTPLAVWCLAVLVLPRLESEEPLG